MNFRIQIDWTLDKKPVKLSSMSQAKLIFFYIMKREKLKESILMCGLAVDTVFEIGFSATY